MCEAAERDDSSKPAKSIRDHEHEQRNRSQAELLKVAYRRKQHADYIDAMLRRAAAAQHEAAGADGDVSETGTRPGPGTPTTDSDAKD